jgi:hypothetical protein
VSGTLRLTTAGTRVSVHDLTQRRAPALARAAGLDDRHPHDLPGDLPDDPEVRVVVEKSHRPFDTRGMVPVTRGAWASGGTVVLEDVGGSGFAQCWTVGGDHVEVRCRWAPGIPARGATVLRSRFEALRAQVLLHHPALWWAGTLGRAPLHVSVLELDGVVVLLAGPGGVGKSTLVASALSSGARATCDNVAACDGESAFGLSEPLRLAVADGAPADGARTTHGRRELAWSGHVPALVPDLVVVLRRGAGSAPEVRTVDPAVAHRALVAGTYAAGELRRFWTLSAVLGLATGRGPVHPEVEAVSRSLTSRLPCLELRLGRVAGPGLHAVLAPYLGREVAR